MEESNLQRWVQGWQDGNGQKRGWPHGDAQAFWEVYLWLWKRTGSVAIAFLRCLVDADKAAELAGSSFWAALEEMDLMVSSGQLLTQPITCQVVQEDGTVGDETIFRGKVSERELEPRKHFEWRGEHALLAFFHDLLISRCRDAVRGEHHQHSAITYDYDAQGNAVPRRVVHQWEHVFLDATRDHTEPHGGAYEGEIAGDAPEENVWLSRPMRYAPVLRPSPRSPSNSHTSVHPGSLRASRVSFWPSSGR